MSKRRKPYRVAPRPLYRELDDLRAFVVRGVLGRDNATPADVYRLVRLARRIERSRKEVSRG